MTMTLAQKVQWFARNLALQIEDILLEKRHVAIDLYFDTVDVTASLLGMEAFYEPGIGFDIGTFQQAKTLVHCLAAGGWLGQIRLLPPHQAEFLNLLNFDFGVTLDERDRQRHIQEFLSQIKAAGALETENEQEHQQNILDFVRTHASSAVNLFKAVQCVRGVNWKRRLVNWGRIHRLKLDDVSFDYARVLRSKELQKIKGAFDLKRPNSTLNNFADAVALAILIDLVRRYQNWDEDGDTVRRVPRLFVSSKLFTQALSSAGLLHFLAYDVDGETSSVLRSEDYFRFKSMFRGFPNTQTTVTLDEELQPLEQLHDQIRQILKAQEPLTESAVNTILFADQPLSKIIEELDDLTFFENVWLPLSGQTEAQDALVELGEAKQQFESESLVRAVEEAIEETKTALEGNVEGYKLVSSLWTQLEHASQVLHSSLRKDPARPLDVFWDLGLLRFDFRPEIQPRILAVVENVFSDEEETQKEARISVIEAYYAFARRDSSTQKAGDLSLAAAVLWVARMDQKLIELLDDQLGDSHYSLKIIFAAACFRLGQKQSIKGGRQILNLLTEEYDETKEPKRAISLAIGLAYLNFHLWDRLGFGPPWRPKSAVRHTGTAKEGEKLIRDAIQYAKTAYSASKEGDLQRHVYALNQYLYYSVEGGGEAQLGTMKTLASELGDFKSDPNLWQYRFDDTLARHLHRLAKSLKTPAKRLELMEKANRHIEAACLGPYKDPEVESYRTEFDLEYATLLTEIH
jgi:hypothetical protein